MSKIVDTFLLEEMMHDDDLNTIVPEFEEGLIDNLLGFNETNGTLEFNSPDELFPQPKQ